MSPFSIQLQNLRRSRGLRQKALADLLCIDPANLCAIENAHRPPPRSEEFLEKLRYCLELSDDEYDDLKARAEITQLLAACRT
jgi:transcriptional regulator with XRE-family HTH domain